MFASFVVNHVPFPVTLIPLFAWQDGFWFTEQSIGRWQYKHLFEEPLV